MKLVVNKTTLAVIKLDDFLRSNRNLTVKADLITTELLQSVDEKLVLHVMSEPPIINQRFEVLSLSVPVVDENGIDIKWLVNRVSPAHINDFYNDVVDNYLDGIAISKGWKNQDRLLAAIDSTNANFNQEARYMRQLVDRAWEIAIPLINDEVNILMSNLDKTPMSEQELIEKLPSWQMSPSF